MVGKVEERIIFAGVLEAFGGAERSVLALARWLHDQGLACRVVLYSDAIDYPTFASFPLKVTLLAPGRASKVGVLRRYLQEAVGEFAPMASGIHPALHLAATGRRGFHTLMHDTPSLADPPTLKQRLTRGLSNVILKRGLSSGGVTFVTSQYLAEETRRLYGGKIVTAHMGGMAGRHDFRLRPVEGRLRLLTVSRVESSKRIDWILASFKDLESASPALSQEVDWALDVVGEGPDLEALQAMARRLGLEDRVTFHGFVDDAVLDQLYDEAHLFLMPARQGYGIPAIEALSRGMPVLTHRESGVSDILLDTPWATVMQGGQDRLTPALDEAIRRTVRGDHIAGAAPSWPTEESWAEQVARASGWVRD